MEHVSVRRLPLWKKHHLQIRWNRDKAVGGLRLERAIGGSGTGKVDIPLDVYLIDSKVEISPLKPQRLTPANAKIIEDRQKQPLRVGSNCLQHALSLLRGQRPAPGALGSLGPNQRDRWVALNQPFRIGRSKDRLQGSDDVVDLRLAGPGKTVDEFLDLHRRNGFHVLHAKPRKKVLDKARLVIRSAGVGDERLLLRLVPLPGIFVKLYIPGNRPAKDVVLPDGFLHILQFPAGWRGHILIDRLAVRSVANGHLAAKLA